MFGSEINGHGHVFGHKFVSESVSEADSDCLHILYVLNYSDKVMTSDSDTDSDTDILRTYKRVRSALVWMTN